MTLLDAMTYCIWPFALTSSTRQTLALPRGAQILSAQWRSQSDAICLWVWCDPEESATEPRTIRTISTGDPVPDELRARLAFIATCQLPDEVLHVFEDVGAENGGARS